MLVVNQLSVTDTERTLLEDVSFSIQKNNWVCLVGASGSGKSLLVKSLQHLLPESLRASGSIMWQGNSLHHQGQTCSIHGCEIGYIPQHYTTSFAPFLTMRQHVRDIYESHDQSVDQAHVDANMAELHLASDLLQRYPGELSGGQLQRFSLLLATLLRPSLLIADEITNALDVVTARYVANRLKIFVETSSSMLWVTHDLAEALTYGDLILVMKDGQIVDRGDPTQILESTHPYTFALLQAAPILKEERTEHVVTR